MISRKIIRTFVQGSSTSFWQLYWNFSNVEWLASGDLKRHASSVTSQVTDKTRDTNCHVEKWFGIVKHSIMAKRKKMTPGTFIRIKYPPIHTTFPKVYCSSLHHQWMSVTPLRHGRGKRQGSWLGNPHTDLWSTQCQSHNSSTSSKNLPQKGLRSYTSRKLIVKFNLRIIIQVCHCRLTCCSRQSYLLLLCRTQMKKASSYSIIEHFKHWSPINGYLERYANYDNSYFMY